MKVLHAIVDMSINGGAQRLVKDLITHSLHDASIEQSLCVLSDNKEPSYIPDLIKLGVKVYQYTRRDFIRFRALSKNYDVLHAHLFPALYMGALSPFKKKIYTEHNTYNNRRKYTSLSHVERHVYHAYDCIGAITPEVKASLIDWLPFNSASHIEVIYNGVDIYGFSGKQHPSRYRPTAKCCHIGMVGSLTEKKDQETIIKSLSTLPSHYHLSLVGEGPKRPMLKQLAVELNVDDRVHFVGVITDVNIFLHSLDLYVQSSKWEGFGLAAVEAMASKKVVFCSDVAGLNNLSEDKALLFKQGDSHELKEKIKALSEDQYKSRMLKISENTARKFTIESTYQGYKRLYLS